MSDMAQARHPELSAFVRDRMYRPGNFVLASGQRSSYYFDGKQASMDPHGAKLIAAAIMREIEDIEIDAIGGMDMGATPIAGAVALWSGQVGRPLPTFVVRKDAKQHGTRKRVEGPERHRNDRVAIVDDVVTTGNSILSAIDAVQELGCEIALAISVVDREAGASEALRERSIRYQPLVTLSELDIKEQHDG
jgi:orotate phosphoribosyltransferase